MPVNIKRRLFIEIAHILIMEQKYINLLSKNKYSLVLSQKTKRPYLDKDFSCYLFELIADGESFCKKIKDTELDKERILKQREYTEEFFFLGIRRIKVKPANGDLFVIELKKEDAPGWKNEEVNASLLRLKQTGQKRYLKNLSDKSLIMAVYIDKRNIKCYPSTHYAVAKTKDGKEYHILFSTLQEFKKWNDEKQKSRWKPLFLPLKKIVSLTQNSHVIINPISDKIILTPQQIKIAAKGEKSRQ